MVFSRGSVSYTHLDVYKRQGIDIAEAEFCAVSHGHYDHGGGLAAFLRANSRAKVYVRSGAFGACYSNKPGMAREYIGLDSSLEADGRIFETGETFELCPGMTLSLIHISGCLNRATM